MHNQEGFVHRTLGCRLAKLRNGIQPIIFVSPRYVFPGRRRDAFYGPCALQRCVVLTAAIAARHPCPERPTCSPPSRGSVTVFLEENEQSRIGLCLTQTTGASVRVRVGRPGFVCLQKVRRRMTAYCASSISFRMMRLRRSSLISLAQRRAASGSSVADSLA